MKVIIAGSRTFTDRFAARMAIKEWEQEYGKIAEVICGGAQGADLIGMSLAEEKEIPVKMFPADWDKFGNAAGPIRNKEMAEYAEGLILLWDGESRGSLSMLKLARHYGLEIQGIIR